MSEEDRRRWQERYQSRPPKFAPSANLAALADRLRPHAATPPPALDLACGYGGNALFLAELGYAVQALDISPMPIAALQAEALRRGAAVTAQVADLDDFPLPAAAYHLIVGVAFLHRPLFARAIAALAPGGLIYWETFALFGREKHHQMNPDFCLQPGELPHLLAGLDILYACEEDGHGRALCLARRSA